MSRRLLLPRESGLVRDIREEKEETRKFQLNGSLVYYSAPSCRRANLTDDAEQTNLPSCYPPTKNSFSSNCAIGPIFEEFFF